MEARGRSTLSLATGDSIDGAMVLCTLIFNAFIIVVFAARAWKRDRLESRVGYAVNALLVPFAVLFAFNLVGGRDAGRLITGGPIIMFLVDDLWYRTLGSKKPKHHPNRWPVHLYVYTILYFAGAILLVGYAFLISLFHGFLVLATFYGSLVAYGYYQYRHKKAGHSPKST